MGVNVKSFIIFWSQPLNALDNTYCCLGLNNIFSCLDFDSCVATTGGLFRIVRKGFWGFNNHRGLDLFGHTGYLVVGCCGGGGIVCCSVVVCCVGQVGRVSVYCWCK